MTGTCALATGTHVLRSLDRPRALLLRVQDGLPVELVIDGAAHPVICIEETWLVERERWHQPISRRYFVISTDDGTRHTIYHDRVADRWYAPDI